jgi:serine/threonine-protein kinase
VTDRAPETIGRYAIEAEVGRGTMGIVYRARDTVLERRVALKTVGGFAVTADDAASFEARFLNEARAAAALSHPNIVAVHDFGRDPVTSTLFIALEFLEGETLEAIARRGPMDWATACRVLARVARALHAAHAFGIVHRDVKPANIMLLPSGEPKVMDFGIARVPASELTRAGEVFGTPSNMSPEQALGEALDGRSDLFSLGTVLYQLVTGRRAFTGDNLPKILSAVVNHTPPPPSSLAAVTAGVDQVIAKALAKSPAERYPTGEAMAEDLEDVVAGRRPRHAAAARAAESDDPLAGLLDAPAAIATIALPAAAVVRARTPGPERRGGRDRWVVGLVAAAALLLAAIGGWRMVAGRPSPAKAKPDVARAMDATVAPASDAPARMTIDFEHHMRSGSVKVWVDDDLVLERSLEGRLIEKLGRVRLYKGRVLETVEVTPERHSVRAEVAWDGKVRAARTAATFRPDGARTLDIEVLRVLDDLTLEWR